MTIGTLCLPPSSHAPSCHDDRYALPATCMPPPHKCLLTAAHSCCPSSYPLLCSSPLVVGGVPATAALEAGAALRVGAAVAARGDATACYSPQVPPGGNICRCSPCLLGGADVACYSPCLLGGDESPLEACYCLLLPPAHLLRALLHVRAVHRLARCDECTRPIPPRAPVPRH